MRRLRRTVFVLSIVVAIVVLIGRSAFLVDETEFVIVTEFGRPVDVFGAGSNETGLHSKTPWQSTRSINRRLHVFDSPAREMMTGDKRNIDVAAYVAWRVVDPLRFLGSAGSIESAEARLNERVSAALSNAVGSRELASIASTNVNVWSLDALTSEVVKSVSAQAREELGVDVVDVRLRRFNHPIEVRPAVFDLIRSERRQVAAALRAEGEAQYQVLTSQADRERDAILAKAEADAERIKGHGDAESLRILNEAHARDPKFYEFLRTLESYKALLDERSTVILSSASPLLRLLTQGPSEELLRDSAPATTSPSEAKR